MGTDALILAIDQGTTNTKALLVDRRGAISARVARYERESMARSTFVES